MWSPKRNANGARNQFYGNMRSVVPGDVIFSICDTRIKASGIVGPTFRDQVVKSRRGQGVFRANVLLRESSCRVTRVDDSRHLKASHIKPWRDAADAERLNGSNGLLLSPHIDHLFDGGYITFSTDQSLVIVPEVRDSLLDAWGIDAGVRVGDFFPGAERLPRLSPRQRVQDDLMKT